MPTERSRTKCVCRCRDVHGPCGCSTKRRLSPSWNRIRTGNRTSKGFDRLSALIRDVSFALRPIGVLLAVCLTLPFQF